MNKLGNYHEDERGHYNFSFSDNDGKHISVSFRAEPDYDLNMVFNEFKNFLIASGHDVDGEIGELAVDGYHEGDGWDIDSDEDSDEEAIQAMKQYQSADGKFSMDHFPNNGWPFGGLTTTALPSITSLDLAGIKSIDLSSINQFPTMSPLTSEQIASWSLPTQQQINSWRVDAPGTIGGAKVEFK